jgi:ankyrin repeat protein
VWKSKLNSFLEIVRRKSFVMAPEMSDKVGSQSKDNLPPLHQAIMKSDRSEIIRLLAENTDIEAKNDQARTPLHVAALLGLEDLVQLLLEADANYRSKGL